MSIKGLVLPQKIRVSVGSAIVLELLKGRIDAEPTTIYLLTYRDGKCLANCGFCPQARTSTCRADMLSRVTWPVFATEQVLSQISVAAEKNKIKRVCIQTLNYPEVVNDILNLTMSIQSFAKIPISVSCQPLSSEQMKKLVDAGVDRISIALDAATKELFDKVKGVLTQSPYTWKSQRKALEDAVSIFGRNAVYTHLIVGLGEREQEIVEIIQWCMDIGVYPSLFAFTSIPGTALEGLNQPSVIHYRRIQLARHLIVHGTTLYENMKFDESGRLINYGVAKNYLKNVVESGIPFQTSGCPGCNRPYYNEKPSGPIYNYPRPLTLEELIEVQKQLEI
jgi:biotin synthase